MEKNAMLKLNNSQDCERQILAGNSDSIHQHAHGDMERGKEMVQN